MDTTRFSAHRSPAHPTDGLSHAARWLLTPWSVAQVCAWLGCTDRWLRSARRDPDAGFPVPLRGPTLRRWPADVLAWSGLALDEMVLIARKLDAAASDTGDTEAAS